MEKKDNLIEVFNHEQPKFLPLDECKIVHEDGTSIPYTEFNNNMTTEQYQTDGRALVNRTFGQAIEALKEGKRVSREGWNGKGMFVFQRPEDELEVGFIIEKVKSLPQSVKDFFKNRDQEINIIQEQGLDKIKFGSCFCMYAADGSIVNGWLASQTDMQANDWCILD